MNVRVFGITGKATLEPLRHKELSGQWAHDEIERWIDVEAATQAELRELLAPLGLPSKILEALLNPLRSSERIISQSTALYLEVPTHLGWDQLEKPYISILSVSTTIITIHRDPEHTIEDIICGVGVDAPLYAHTCAALLYYLLIEIGRQNVDAALAVRGEADRLDMAAQEDPQRLDPKVIADLRRRIAHYAAVNDEHTYCAGILQTVESEAFRISAQGSFFHEMLRLSELARQIIAGAQARVSALQREYELCVQSRVDKRLQFLTILSAVFLPLTLISAIYGMNFNDLPGMGMRYGYLIVIAMMLGTAGVTGAYLYARGWFE